MADGTRTEAARAWSLAPAIKGAIQTHLTHLESGSGASDELTEHCCVVWCVYSWGKKVGLRLQDVYIL